MDSFLLRTNHANKPVIQLQKVVEHTLPWLVLAILVTFSFAKLFRHPYGFGWEPNGEIYAIFVDQPEPTLKVGDQILQIGSLTWDAFRADLRKTFFEGIKIGEIVNVIVERDGQVRTISWKLPGTNKNEFLEHLFSEWLFCFVFWGAGTITLLHLRPRDERWRLFSAFNFLTAIWLSAGGGLSNYQIWYSALVLRAVIWLCIPIYLHLHWVFPRPLGNLPPLFLVIGYAAAAILIIAQLFQILDRNLYFLGFMIAVLGSLILLIVHARVQPDIRGELRVIWVALSLSLIPLFVIAIVSFVIGSSRANSLALISFPVLPLAYLYTAYRNQLGGLEIRVNRLLSAYFFVILLMTIAVPLLAIANRFVTSPDGILIVGSVAAIIATTVSIWLFPPFQNFVESRWLGISLRSEQLPLIYSRHATASTSLTALIGLLRKDVLPSLLVREFLFVRLDRALPEVLLVVGINENQLQNQILSSLTSLKSNSAPHLSLSDVQPFPWVKLMLPLTVGDELLGYWFFGRRDPDDIYSEIEMPILQSLADQTAITLSNISKTERLRVAYKDDIDRFEQERLRLALELHDNILNELAALLMKLDDRSLTPAFQAAYNELIKHLRDIIRDLKPAILTYGLEAAIKRLADNLMEQSGDKVNIAVHFESTEARYPEDVERHLFRMVQEACMNALRHAEPKEITITGRLAPVEAEIEVKDNGTGFDIDGELNFTVLEANNHFGLKSIFERAELIGADVKIESVLTKGTLIRIRWKPVPR